MKTMNKKSFLAICLALALLVSGLSVTPVADKVVRTVAPSAATVQMAKAAVSSNNVIYDGEGEITQVLANGKTAKIVIKNGVVTLTVDGEKFAYETGVTAFTAVFGPDDIAHFFWGTGRYDWYDCYENARYGTCYKLYATQKYCSQDFAESGLAYKVIGNSTANSVFHSCIWDSLYFFQEGKSGKKRLITRAEIDGFDEDPSSDPTVAPATETPATQAPTVAPATEIPATQAPQTVAPATETPATQAPQTDAPRSIVTPAPTCGCANGGKCTCPDGQCKCPNCSCATEAPCHETQAPRSVETPQPTCGCANGGTCNCPDGQCKCPNCSCATEAPCHTAVPRRTVAPVAHTEVPDVAVDNPVIAPNQDAKPVVTGNDNIVPANQDASNDGNASVVIPNNNGAVDGSANGGNNAEGTINGNGNTQNIYNVVNDSSNHITTNIVGTGNAINAAPQQASTGVVAPTVTVAPKATAEPTATTKAAVKKAKKKYPLRTRTTANHVTTKLYLKGKDNKHWASMFKLKNKVLNFNNIKYRNVKAAGYNKKTNLLYLTENGYLYRIKRNTKNVGKVKLIATGIAELEQNRNGILVKARNHKKVVKIAYK